MWQLLFFDGFLYYFSLRELWENIKDNCKDVFWNHFYDLVFLKISERLGCLLYFCEVMLSFQRESIYFNSRKRGANPAVTFR